MIVETDEKLARRFWQDGNSRAVEILFHRRMRMVYALASSYLAQKEDAEEAASETFLRFFRALREGQFRQASSIKTYLTRIAVNVCLERLRQPRLPALSLSDMPDIFDQERTSETDDVRAALDVLPDDQRLVLMLCDVQGYQAREAAEVFGRSVTATKSLHYRARRALRDELMKMKKQHDEM